ncbi:DUF3990 domain-containing protein [Azospirillum thiophilum]|uniref:DUF3990 domain-containing protein n=2 Tax=Azospirillum thiophilum TaxID=528244 RepID=UPI00118755B0
MLSPREQSRPCRNRSMFWLNPPLVVYHGTYDEAAAAMMRKGSRYSHSVDVGVGRPNCDFGPGFYVTTDLGQAREWANIKTRRLRASRMSTLHPLVAVVVRFEIDRTALSELDSLVFQNDGEVFGFWPFVEDCRAGRIRAHGREKPYDVVYGPVTAWPQRSILPDRSQISFHTERGSSVLGSPDRACVGRPFL